MDLAYNPGELDYKKETNLKRDHDSVDDFEHVASPSVNLSKLEIEDSSEFTNNKPQHEPIVKLPASSNEEDQFGEVDFSPKTTLLDSEVGGDNLYKLVEPVKDNILSSDLISAEKVTYADKTEMKDPLELVKSENYLIAHEDSPNNDKPHIDLNEPVKSMKEADAMSHYEIKIDKKGPTKDIISSELVEDTFGKSVPAKELINNQALLHDDFMNVDVAKVKKEEDIDSEKHISAMGDDSISKSATKDDVILKNKDNLISSNHEQDRPEKVDPTPQLQPRQPEQDSATSDLDDIIGPEDVFKRFGLDAWFTPGRLHPIVEALVYWRDPKKSGVVFGVIMAILLSLCYMSLISVVAYTSLIALAITINFRIYKNVLQAVQKTSEGHPFKEYFDLELALPADKVREIVDTAVVHINAAIVELRRLFLVEHLIDSFKFALCLWCLTYVGAIFNGMTLVILAFVALFTVPKIYENNKTSFDTFIGMVLSKVAEITSKVKAAVPIGKKEPEKDKEQ